MVVLGSGGFDLKIMLFFPLPTPFATTKLICLYNRAAQGHFSLTRFYVNGVLAACYTWKLLAAVDSKFLLSLQEGKT